MIEGADGKRLVGEGFDPVLSPMLRPLAMAFKRTIAMVERESGVGALKWFVLTMVARGDGLSQGEVCQVHELDPSRVTRMAQSLEGEGLIRRERDPGDNRVVRMYLTADGARMLERLPDLNEKLERRVREALSEEEQRELERLLDALSEAMKK